MDELHRLIKDEKEQQEKLIDNVYSRMGVEFTGSGPQRYHNNRRTGTLDDDANSDPYG